MATLWLCLISASSVFAAERVVELDIPGQSLVTALDSFSRATGMAVLIDRQLTEGRRSARVRGRFEPRQGLEMMLAGCGLMAMYSGAGGFTLKPVQIAGQQAPLAASGAASLSFATALQEAVEKVLCQSPETRPGAYRAVLQLWIGPFGEVLYSRLLNTTGDYQRDDALIQSVGGVVAQRAPPSSMRQPVTLLLESDTAGKRMDCRQWVSGGRP